MPELPEVQTVINSIRPDVIGRDIISCELLWGKVIYNIPQHEFHKNIINKRIIEINRHGKYIIFILSYGFMLCHLRMTGTLYIDTNKKFKKHIQAIFSLKNKSTKYLFFKDIRKFGGFYYYDKINLFRKKIGIDPFNSIFTKKWLIENLKSRRRQIKHLLLDQSILSGLGNIYIDEALWASQIHPKQISNRISKQKTYLLYENIVDILKHSLEFHGTSIKDFTYDNLRTGEFKKHIKVFNRVDQQCYNCSTTIMKIRVAARGTHICPSCQKIS